MNEIESALVLMAALLASVGLGIAMRLLLPERHRSRETLEVVQLVIGMLVTLASVVLGLLTYSVKGNFDQTSSDLGALGSGIIQINRMLAEYGPEADPIRVMLRAYTAGAIASTWPAEVPPPGDYYPRNLPPVAPGRLETSELGTLLNQAELATRRLVPRDNVQDRLAADAVHEFQALIAARWRLIDDARSTITLPFFLVLCFWLVVIFGCFGFMTPYRNAFLFGMTALAALSVSSAMFVILDMDTPLGGLIAISSAPLRDALAHLLTAAG
jgi:hypothetical protein